MPSELKNVLYYAGGGFNTFGFLAMMLAAFNAVGLIASNNNNRRNNNNNNNNDK